MILKNTGCEFYVHVFRFEIPSQNKSIDDVTYWYKRLVKLLSQIEDGVDSPINIQKAKITLVNHIDQYANHPVKLGTYMTIEEGDVATMMVFEKIRDIGDNKIAIELNIWIGPL